MIADILLLAVLVTMTVLLLRNRTRLQEGRRGLYIVLAGLLWACLAALFDVLFVGEFRLFENTAASAETMLPTMLLGYIPALVTMVVGFLLWLPALVRLDQEVGLRKQGEAALRRTQDLLLESQAIAGIGSWTWNVSTHRYSAATEQFYRLHGLDPEAGLAALDEIEEMVHPEDRARHALLLDQARVAEKPVSGGYRILVDGRIRFVELRSLPPERTPEGEVLRGTLQDVTGQRRAELMLRDSIESADDAFILFDEDDRVLMFNDRYRDLFAAVGDRLRPGLTHEEVSRLLLESGQITEAIGREDAWLAERLARDRTAGADRIQRFEDGRVVRLRERPTRLGGMVTIRSDITEIYRAQVEAEEQARAVQTLLETAPVSLAILRDERFVFANKRIYDLFAVPDGELIGRPGPDFFADPAQHKVMNDALRRDRVITGLEIEVAADDGSRSWVTVNAAPIRYLDGGALFVGLLDITERKAAEERLAASETRFRTIAQGVPVPLCISRPADGGIVFANAPFRELLELGERSLFGLKMSEFYVNPAQRSMVVERVTRDGVVDSLPLEMRTARGRSVSTQHSIRTIEWDGETALFGAILDVSDQQRIQRELIEALSAAEAANDSKSQFLAVMSHELRTPLNAILGFSEVMMSEVFGPMGNPRYQEYAGDIHASGQHLLALISDVLDLSRIEAGRLELNEVPLQPGPLSRDLIRFVEARAREIGSRIVLEDRTDGEMVLADERCLKQVLLNLLSNAVKFSYRNTDIELLIARDEEGALEFRVFNHGDGIAEEDIERVMQPFTQIQSAHARTEHGTGLGLSISRRLMEAHQGSLELRSEPGKGLTALARFPSSRVRAADKVESLRA